MPDQTPNPEPLSELEPVAPAPMDAPDDGEPASADQYDAANASLAGALAVSFAVLRIVMVLLIVVFLFSGFFTVAPDEVAVRTRFGKIVPSDESEVLTAEGGPYFRWPAPIGQVYRIPTTTRELELSDSFVFAAARTSRQPLSELTDPGGLDPELDGALLTADKAIVHARYRVSYRVQPANAATFVRNVASVAQLDPATNDPSRLFAAADLLVENAVERAIVADVAATPLDRFLQGGRGTTSAAATTPAATPEEAGEPSNEADQPATGEETDAAAAAQPAEAEAQERAGEDTEPQGDQADAPAGDAPGTEEDQIRAAAQRVLDELGSGITIETVARTEAAVMSAVRGQMSAVQVEIQRAGQMLSEAETERNQRMIGSAGPAWEAVLAVIDVYEEAGRLRESSPELYEAAQAALDATFAGEELGTVLTSLAAALPEENPQRANLQEMAEQYASARLGGSAGSLIANASASASSYVTQLESEADQFEGLLATYRQKPELVRSSLFANALRAIWSGEDVQTTVVLPGSQLRLQLNRDPEVALEEEARAREQRGERGRGDAGGR